MFDKTTPAVAKSDAAAVCKQRHCKRNSIIFIHAHSDIAEIIKVNINLIHQIHTLFNNKLSVRY